MRTFIVNSLLLLLLSACAAGGGDPRSSPEPLSWPQGRYLLEGTVAYNSGLGTRRDTHIAHLVVGPGGAMALDSETGVCRDPTEADLRRDRRAQRRTFQCGDVVWVLRPASATVVGEIHATVMEDREVRECVQYRVNADGQRVCIRSRSVVESQRVTREARLRVSEES